MPPRHIERIAIMNLARDPGKTVPDGFPFAIFKRRALQLRCGGGHTPDKFLREYHRRSARSNWIDEESHPDKPMPFLQRQV